MNMITSCWNYVKLWPLAPPGLPSNLTTCLLLTFYLLSFYYQKNQTKYRSVNP